MGKAKVGDNIKIIEMLGEPSYTGRVGIVEFIDGVGQLHGSWGGLAIQEDNDRYIVIEGGVEEDDDIVELNEEEVKNIIKRFEKQ